MIHDKFITFAHRVWHSSLFYQQLTDTEKLKDSILYITRGSVNTQHNYCEAHRKSITPDMELITEEHFRQLFRNLYPGLLNYALSLHSDEDMKDVVQEAFVELWKRHDNFADDDHVKAFLYKTVYTRTLNIVRHKNIVNDYSEKKKQIELRKMQYYHPELSNVVHEIESGELRQQIEAAVNELPEKCRMAFTLSYLHGMKNKEISELMKISVRTVDTHIFKALRYLRKRLGFLEFE